MAYNRLKNYLGITTGAACVYDMWQQLALTEEPLMQRFGIDVIPLNQLRVAFGSEQRRLESLHPARRIAGSNIFRVQPRHFGRWFEGAAR